MTSSELWARYKARFVVVDEVGITLDTSRVDLDDAFLKATRIAVERQGDEINLKLPSGISFDFNSAAVKPEFRPVLDQVAQTLASYQSTFVDISGHTDSIGSDAVNQRLSEQRAKAVADYLGYQGVNAARVATRGFGKTYPIASNDTEQGRAENRRVEIKLSPVTQQDFNSAGQPPRR